MKKIRFFYLSILGITGIIAMLLGGIFQQIKGNEVMMGLILTMGVQLSPMLAFFITRKKYKEKISLNFKLRMSKWLLLSILVPVAIISITACILSLLGISYIQTEFTGSIFWIALITTIIGSIGEEIGWRGYLLNACNEKYTYFMGSVITGLLWGCWHFFKIGNSGIIGYLLFIPTIVLFGIIMGYLYIKSNKSLINMILFHSCINISTIVFLYNRECNTFYLTLSVVSIFVVLLLLVCDRTYFKLKK